MARTYLRDEGYKSPSERKTLMKIALLTDQLKYWQAKAGRTDLTSDGQTQADEMVADYQARILAADPFAGIVDVTDAS